MGENDASSDDPPLKMTKDGDIRFPKLGKITSKKDECSSDASPKPLYSNPKRRRTEQDTDAIISDDKSLSQSDIVDVSPVTKSRYGRTHKPKIPEDFLPTDKKVAAILGRSPHKSPGKVSGSPSSSMSVEMTKVCQKGRRLHDIFVKKDRRSKGNTESEELNKSSNTENMKLEKSDIGENNEDEIAALSVMFTPESVKREATSDTSGVLVEKNKTLSVGKSSEIDWVIGDLAWARVTGYPFWPCMIALDPQMGNFTRTTVRGNITLRSLHVQFFGDNGRRSWLYCNCVIPFEGLEALHKLSLKFQSEGMKKRFRKVAAAFHVGPKAKAKWDIAVAEAEDALKQTRIERLQDFATKFPLDASVKSTKSENQSASPQDRQNVIKLVKTPKHENQSPLQDKQTVKTTKIAKSDNHITSPQQKQTVRTVKTAKSENLIASPQEKQTVKAIKIAKSNNRSLSPQEKQAVKATKNAKSVNQSASPQLKHTPKTSRTMKSENLSASPQDVKFVKTTKSEYQSPRQSVKAAKVTKSENQSPSPQTKQSVKATRITKSENQSPSPQNKQRVKAIRITKSENQSPSPQNKQSAKAIRNTKSENENASPQAKQRVKAIRITKPEDEIASPQDKQGVKAINESASPQNKQGVKAVRITKPEDESAPPQDNDSVKAIRITKPENQNASPQDKQSVRAIRITKSENQDASPQDKQTVKAIRITKLENQSVSPYSRRSIARRSKQHKRLSEKINSTPKAVKSEDVYRFRSPSPELPIDISTKELISSVISDTKMRISSPSVKKKHRKKYGGQKLGADFEAFLYKHIDRVTQEHPELSTKKVEKYLAKEWAEMDDQDKSKFCARLNVSEGKMENTEASSSEEDEDEKEEKDEKDDRESNSSEKADSSGTRESSPAPLFKLKKGGGLFRGTKQEKVCQICEKPGDTVKCRGPCCGTFHLECLSKLEKERSESTANSVEDKENEVSTSQNEDTSVVNENGEQIRKEDTESHKGINMDSKDEVVLTVNGGDEQEDKEKETENKKEVNTDDQNGDISNIGESSEQIKEKDTEDNKKLLENVEETSEKIPESKNCISSSAENNESVDEKESQSISRKRKRSESEEQMGPSEKKIDLDEERQKGETVNEKIDDNCETEVKNNDAICLTGIEDSVKNGDDMKMDSLKNGDDMKMDVDKVTDENIEKVSCEDKTKQLDHMICNSNAKESDEENTIDHDLEEVVSLTENKSEIKEDNNEGERNSNEENDKEKRDPEKDISKRERRSIYKVKKEEHKKGGDEDEVIGQKNEALSSQDKYKKETRGTVRRKEEEERKEELMKDIKANPEEKDKDDKKDKKNIAKKKDKEEKKGRSNEVEEKAPNEVTEFRCKDCQEGRNPPCFGCGRIQEKKTGKEQRQRCVVGHCGKFYHIECLKLWPHASSSGGAPSRRQSAAAARGEDISIGHGAVTCPQHVCHTCASDDPRNATTRFAHERLVRCIRCPTAYHTGNYCLPAGSEVLTGSQIICPKHYKPPLKRTYHVNAAWCFICAMGGSLICCDLCPTAFHAECVKISPPEGSFICEDCDTGRFPLYGEIVWVKLGSYRWWPAQILYPNQIPENIRNLPHVLGEFAVRFFGSHDHYWVNRGRVFLYQEGDTGHSTNRKSYMEGMFSRALQEASEAQATLKSERAVREAEAVLKPPMYVKIKYNRPVGNVRVMEMDPASMTPCDCDPTSENPCGPDTDCLNRILLLECNPSVCTAGDRCRNQCFEKRLYPQLRPMKTNSRGWGLVTLENIRKGDFVIEYVGEMIDEAEYQRRMTRKHEEKDENFYFLTIDKDRMLDAGPKGNVARFMNHSCQPNCETQKWTVNGDTRVGLFALKDIPAGTELTFNYNLECVGPDKKPCMCGAPNCSGFIGMKATKQQMEEDKKSRIDPQILAKRRYKKRRSGIRVNDDLCFVCGEGGDLIICENKTCPKGYHLLCLKLKNSPEGKWLCPWHRCNVCHKRTIRRCNYCPNSFCPIHAEGNIGLHTHGFVCSKHDKVTASGVAESLDSLAAVNSKVGTEEEGVSEESSVSTLECNDISKEVETKAEDCDGVQNGSNNETEAVTAVHSVERDTLELNSSSSEGQKIVTCDKLPDSSVESCAVLDENTAKNGEVTIQNGEPSTNGDTATDLNIAVTDEQSTPVQNVSTTFEANNVVQRAKRGRPRKSVVQENLNTSKNGNTNPPCTTPDEHQSVAVSSTNNEILQTRLSKFGRRYSEKFKSLVAEENGMLNGLSPGTTTKGRRRQRKISSVVSKPGFEEGSVPQEEQCNGVDVQADSTVKDEESAEKNVVKDVENASLHLKADSSIEVETKCNETINGTTDILSVNGIESSGVLILPIES